MTHSVRDYKIISVTFSSPSSIRVILFSSLSACLLKRLKPSFHQSSFLAGPITILEPHYQKRGELYAVQEHRTTDFEAPKMLKGPSVSVSLLSVCLLFC